MGENLMMRKNQPPSGKKADHLKSRVITIRVNPFDPEGDPDGYERAALEVWDEKRKQFSAREIWTDAINFAAGHTPEMFRQGRAASGTAELGERIGALDQTIANMLDLENSMRQTLDMLLADLPAILNGIKQSDPEGFRAFANADDTQEGGDLSAKFITNAQKAVRSTWSERRKGKSIHSPNDSDRE